MFGNRRGDQRVGSLRPLSLRFFDRILKSKYRFLCKFKQYTLNLIMKRLDLGMKQCVVGSSMRILLMQEYLEFLRIISYFKFLFV